jgi:bifunctional DNA-binding transcriptional regulator/antitoxin component of YhaV-PrlF toxin-antitoxin module
MTSVTITSKWQVTIPEEIRKELPALQVGQRLRWEIVDGVLTAKPVRSLTELAGCLKSADMPKYSRPEEKAAIEQARAEHYQKKYAKA